MTHHFTPTPPTRTGQTSQRYLTAYTLMIKRFSRGRWKNFDEAFLANCKNWQSSTIKYYLAAVRAVVGDARADSLRRRIPGGLKKKRDLPKKTSAQKRKSFPSHMRLALVRHFRNKNAPFYNFIAAWLILGQKIGARPCEMETVIFKIPFTDDPHIFAFGIKNAKFSNGRANGFHREMFIEIRDKDEINALVTFFKFRKEMTERFTNWASLVRRVTKEIRSACKELKFKKPFPTLYSLRHQFAANLKRSNIDQGDRAALMGHGSSRTSNSSYAKRRYGESINGIITPGKTCREKVRVYEIRQFSTIFENTQKPS